MSRNLEAKITKQMRDLIEAKLKLENATPEEAVEGIAIFMQDFDDQDKHLINQYAKYVQHLLKSEKPTKHAWDKFLLKLEEHRLNKKANKAVKHESIDAKQAFKQSLEDLKEYDKLSKLLKAPKKSTNGVEEVNVADRNDNELFNPFDEEVAAQLADVEAVENDQDWTINDDEFDDDEFTIDATSLGSLERNADFDGIDNVDALKDKFAMIKNNMQNKIDELTQQVDSLKFKLSNYETRKLDGYEIADENDDIDLAKRVEAQRAPEGQQTMDFSIDHTNEKLEDIKTPEDEDIVDEILNTFEDSFMPKTSEETAVFDDDIFADLKEGVEEPENESTQEVEEPQVQEADEQSEEESKDDQWVDDKDEDTVAIADDFASALSDALGGIQIGEMEPTAHFSFNSAVTDKDGKEYHVAGSRKNSKNRTEYLVKNDEGETFTFNSNDLEEKK